MINCDQARLYRVLRMTATQNRKLNFVGAELLHFCLFGASPIGSKIPQNRRRLSDVGGSNDGSATFAKPSLR